VVEIRGVIIIYDQRFLKEEETENTELRQCSLKPSHQHAFSDSRGFVILLSDSDFNGNLFLVYLLHRGLFGRILLVIRLVHVVGQ
jgi:hypothetical protein